jgi:exodeoxyribonuclease VII large subunit
MVSPDQGEWLSQVGTLQARIGRHIQQGLLDRRQRMDWLNKRLQLRHPGQYLRQQAQRLDEFEQRIRLSIQSNFSNLQSSLHQMLARLKQATPGHRIARYEVQLHGLVQRMNTAIGALLEGRQRQLASACRTLDAVSPLATLERGYAIVTRPASKTIIRTVADIKAGEQIEARLADGGLLCTVDKTLKSVKNT